MAAVEVFRELQIEKIFEAELKFKFKEKIQSDFCK